MLRMLFIAHLSDCIEGMSGQVVVIYDVTPNVLFAGCHNGLVVVAVVGIPLTFDPPTTHERATHRLIPGSSGIW